MASTRIQWLSSGFTDLLGDKGVQADLLARAQRVQAAASAGGARDVQIVPDDHPTRRALHIGSDDRAALDREAADGALARALDAAGGA